MVRDVSGRVFVAVLAVPSFVCYLFLLDSSHLRYATVPEDDTSHSFPMAVAAAGSSSYDTAIVSEEPPEDTDDLWWWDWEQVQRNRRVALHRACHQQIKSMKVRTLSRLLVNRRYLYNLLVDEKHKAIYCYVPKVACTNWKRMMMILAGRTNESDPLNIRSSLPHEEGVLTRLSDSRIKSSLLSYKLRTYTKFLFVRDPIERLVSAYRNKLVINSTSAADFKRRYGITIMKKYRKGGDGNHNNNISKSGHGVTFSEFVSYLTDTQQEGHESLNEHWAPYVDLCHPCAVKYNIIGKYETLEEDSEYVLRKIGAPSDLHFPPVFTSRTASLVADHMASLPHNLSRNLYNLYKPDFKLFGYDYVSL